MTVYQAKKLSYTFQSLIWRYKENQKLYCLLLYLIFH